MSPICVDQPAVQADDGVAGDGAAVGLHAGDAARFDVDARDLGVRVDLGAAAIGSLARSPRRPRRGG